MDEDYIIIEHSDVSIVTVPQEQVVVVTPNETPTVLAITDESYVVLEQESINVVAVGQQGPAGADGSTGAAVEIILEAGENLSAGTPAKVIGNKVFSTTHTDDDVVIGIVKYNATATFLATVTVSGILPLSGLVPNTPYFLGVGVLVYPPPATGHVVRLGSALTTDSLLVCVEEPILLT